MAYFVGETDISSPVCCLFMYFVHRTYKANHEHHIYSHLASCSGNIVSLAKARVASASLSYYKVITFHL